MADEKISQLADGVTPDDADEFVVARGADNNKLDWASLKAAIPGGAPSGPAGGDLDGTYPDPTLAAVGSATGPIGDATHVAATTIDTKGRVTALTSVAITGTAPGGAAGGDLTGTYPNPTLAASGPGAIGPIGDATHVAAVSTDAKGRVTALTSTAITGTAPGGAAGGDLSGTYPNPALSVAKQAELDGKVPKSLYDANTVLAADTDNTPAAVTMGASTILARLAAGNIKAASVAEILTLLDTPTNAQAILKTFVDAKGDLISATANDTPARLAVGASDYMGLVSSSGQSTGLQWVPGASVLLYDYTVAGSDKATIDTGVDTPDAGIAGTSAFPTGFRVLEIFAYLQNDQSGSQSCTYIVNNDTSSIYDLQRVSGTNVTTTSSPTAAGASWTTQTHGTGGTSGYPSTHQLVFLNYGGTALNKVGTLTANTVDATAATNQILLAAIGYRSTSAITRIKVNATSTFKFKVGSRITIYAR